MSDFWAWLTLFGLGAYHGINPGMGWLFAVALGLQERRRSAVLQALLPISLGHAAAILITVLVVVVAQVVVAPDVMSYFCAGTLILFGLYKLVKRMHPRWVGMRVGFKDLTAWSFLMATAHGAGLMLVPVLLQIPVCAPNQNIQSARLLTASSLTTIPGLTAVAVHTLGMFVVMGIVALVVYEKLGLALLRRVWFNFDLLWGWALILAGIITLVIPPLSGS